MNVCKIFDENSGWSFAPREVCEREKIFPNGLAYNKEEAAIALVINQGRHGDASMGQAGLDYICAALEKGELKVGKPVTSGWVVVAEPAKNGSPRKFVRAHTAEEMRKRFNGMDPWTGAYGPYFWVASSVDDWSD